MKATPQLSLKIIPALALDTSRILVGPPDRGLRVSELAHIALMLQDVALGHAHPFEGVKVLRHVAWALR
jgi:hypothetical protein